MNDGIVSAHRQEIQELEDAILSDDHEGRPGCGVVLWAPQSPLHDLAEWFNTL
ncbi:MAG: hypothetical protein ACRDTO_15220 [Mycobacterium sp.]